MTDKTRSFSLALCVLILLAGAGLRIRQYAFNRSLWLDEAMLANEVIKPAVVLPAAYQITSTRQAAPPGFMAAAKASTLAFGRTDIALRAFPIACGLLALVAALGLGTATLKSVSGRACFMALVSFSPILVYYSSEFKQYATDVLASILILRAGVRFQGTKKDLIALALLGCIAVWFSHASIFVLAGTGATLLSAAAARRQVKTLWSLCVIVAAWLASFAILYWLSRGLISEYHQQMARFWADGYAPHPLYSRHAAKWLWESALGLIYLAFRQAMPVPLQAMPQWFDAFNICLTTAVGVGMCCLFFRCPRLFWCAALSIAAAMMASAAQLYPFRSRLILFLVPCIFLGAAGLVDWLATRGRASSRWAAWLVFSCLVTAVLVPSLRIARRPCNTSDIRRGLAYVRDHRGSSDSIALSAWSGAAFEFYSPRYGLENVPVVAPISRDFEIDPFVRDLCASRPAGRTWVIFSHRINQKNDFLQAIRARAPQLDVWEGTGAGVYLFDFSGTNLCSGPST